jgi:glycine/D-amino acid oxidase-like deaminating enzyme
MTVALVGPSWGETPWVVDFRPETLPLPETLDFAVIGGGFSGLSAAAALRRLDPEKSVAVFEAARIGARSSGHTGGLALDESAAGDLPGLGNVLAGFTEILNQLHIDCDLELPGVLELDRSTKTTNSPIHWIDSGQLRVAREVSGGTVDPGKLVSGLGRAATSHGALIFENARVDEVDFGSPLTLHVRNRQIRCQRLIIATNAESLELSGLDTKAESKLTLATATAPISNAKMRLLGATTKPFYTIDLSYLWGRLLNQNQIIFGSGLVAAPNWRDLISLDLRSGEPREAMSRLQRRVTKLHSALADVSFSHSWAGPILISRDWRPVFGHHPKSSNVIVLGAYSGHGVALSVYLGLWAAQALLNRRELPSWNLGDTSYS